jgi:hypothetical protein
MNSVVTGRIALLEELLRALTNAAYETLCASNAIDEGEPVPASFSSVLEKLDKAWTDAHDYFEPIEAEKRRKWENACATASYIMDRLKEDCTTGTQHPNMIDSHLHRNIADAINGNLLQTAADRENGVRPTTMNDTLSKLVAEKQLVEWRPDDM